MRLCVKNVDRDHNFRPRIITAPDDTSFIDIYNTVLNVYNGDVDHDYYGFPRGIIFDKMEDTSEYDYLAIIYDDYIE